MSLTFSIDGIREENGHDLPCPDCGLTLADPHGDPDCTCMGYGGPEVLPQPRFELNVSNGNGCDLLRILGVPATCVGELDPRDLLVALELHDVRDRYREVLRRIAEQAVKYDRKVVWG